jgi:hypothetical protein
MSIQLKILCDGGLGPLTACLNYVLGKTGDDYRMVRMQALSHGWIVSNEQDYCPRHLPQQDTHAHRVAA